MALQGRLRPTVDKVRAPSAHVGVDPGTKLFAIPGPAPLLKYYLVAYNLLSALAWLYVLTCTVVHVFALDQKYPELRRAIPYFPPPSTRSSSVLRGRSPFPPWARDLERYLPGEWVPALRRAATTYERVGWQTTIVQTFAVLEVVHSVLGWVRSPLVTVMMQVASRYYSVWGVTFLFPNVRRMSRQFVGTLLIPCTRLDLPLTCDRPIVTRCIRA